MDSVSKSKMYRNLFPADDDDDDDELAQSISVSNLQFIYKRFSGYDKAFCKSAMQSKYESTSRSAGIGTKNQTKHIARGAIRD